MKCLSSIPESNLHFAVLHNDGIFLIKDPKEGTCILPPKLAGTGELVTILINFKSV